MRVTYVKTGTPGYGPDLEPDDVGCETLAETCRAVREELGLLADMLEDSAEAYADADDFEAAWKTHKRADDLETLRANLDWDKRQHAPVYRDDRPALEETMRYLLGRHFPLDVDDHVRLYVWEAETDD